MKECRNQQVVLFITHYLAAYLYVKEALVTGLFYRGKPRRVNGFMLHIGSDCLIRKKDIIAILDVSALNAKDTQYFFEHAQDITKLTDEYSSLVLTSRDGVQHIYLSPISCATLYKRSYRTEIIR